MSKYIDAEKLKAEIEKLLAKAKNDEEKAFAKKDAAGHLAAVTKTAVCVKIKKLITSLQQEQPKLYFYCKYGGTMPLCSDCKRNHNNSPFKTEEIATWYSPSNGTKHCIDYIRQEQPNNIIQWTGNNLKEVIDFTGKSPKFGEWFKSWEEYEKYVHTHNDILKLFCDDGSHYEVPVYAWIVKMPDGHIVPSVANYVQQEQSEVDLEQFDKDITKIWGRCAAEPNDSIACLHIETFNEVARHFFELGKNARKEE